MPVYQTLARMVVDVQVQMEEALNCHLLSLEVYPWVSQCNMYMAMFAK